MKTLREFYQFVLKEEAEAPANAEFGQYAFAPTRKELPSPKEPNTREEEEAKEAIEDYLVSNRKGDLDQQALKLYQLAQQGYYKKVLSPDEYSEAYRILETSAETLASILGVKDLGVEGVTGPGVLRPHEGNISGWTVNPKFLIKNMPNYGKGYMIAVFAADIGSNKFFGNPGNMASAVDVAEMDVEKETIAIGPVNYTKCSYAKLTTEIQSSSSQRNQFLLNVLGKVMQ